MKIKRLKLENFANFTEFECEFDGNITHLVGVNGSGKTTIGLTAIWACLKGIAEKSKDGQLIGERFRFIGNNRQSADIELIVFDEKTNNEIRITNHITKQSNKIVCDPIQDENWLNELFSVAFLSAKNFTQLTSKDQALLLGINTQKFDEKISYLKNEFTFLNREYKNFGELTAIEKVEKIDISLLIKEKEKIESEYYNKQRIIDEHNSKAIIRNEQIQQCNDKIIELKKQLSVCEKWLNDNPSIVLAENLKEPDLKEISNQIENAEDINNKAILYQEYLNRSKEKEIKKSELEKNKEKQKKEEIERLNYIKSFNFNIQGLIINENGGLLLNNKPIKEPYFSKGELEIIVAKLYASIEPELKMRFIDDFELLDENNQENLVKDLLNLGFQIITAEVGKKSVKKNTILLRECKKISSYEEEKQLKLL